MAIQASAQAHSTVAPTAKLPFVDPQNGTATASAQQFMQQLYDFVNGINRTLPANASTVSNVITLTLLSVQPVVTQYASYDSFGFVADVTSTGNLSAAVVTTQATLAVLPVYKTNGATRAAAGDVVKDSQYFLTFVDTLNTGNGGFVLR